MSPQLALIERARAHGDRSAVVAAEGRFTYDDLLGASARAASALLAGAPDLDERRIAFLVAPGFGYLATQWGIWRAGGIAVPLCPTHPAPELEYAIEDSGADTLVADPELHPRIESIVRLRRLRLLAPGQVARKLAADLPAVDESRPSMILYTSGTTSKPKGVVHTHCSIRAQIETLAKAWEWSADDHVLSVLPLHHVHGIVNVLCCALWAGGTSEIAPQFDAADVWRRFGKGAINVFMAVPTIYTRLIDAWEQAPEPSRRSWAAACAAMRLMVSGSAALPVRVLERWREISGHVLLERYGMTEIGMALSNPLHGERRAGYVGTPLPGVDIRLVDDEGQPINEGPGEIQVRGAGVFREYWQRTEATRDSFADGWFKTGDVAVIEDGSVRILGRQGIDIIKTGGYKVSALEIEEVLRQHPSLRECAVVAVPDPEWGERVAAAVTLHEGADLGLEELRFWARERLAIYKVPTMLRVLEALPRNALGKVTKASVVAEFGASQADHPR